MQEEKTKSLLDFRVPMKRFLNIAKVDRYFFWHEV
jgi:hypothetical protein